MHHPDDVGQRRVLAHLGGPEPEGARLVDRRADPSSPTLLSTGSDSPVTIDSSTADAPSTISPSTGIFSPGRTTTMSPTSTSSTGMSICLPSRTTRAVLAWSPISFLIASEVRPLARSSMARPRSPKAMTTTVTSQ
jgi:hypothetical protein